MMRTGQCLDAKKTMTKTMKAERGRKRRGKRGTQIDRETAGDCARERERER